MFPLKEICFSWEWSSMVEHLSPSGQSWVDAQHWIEKGEDFYICYPLQIQNTFNNSNHLLSQTWLQVRNLGVKFWFKFSKLQADCQPGLQSPEGLMVVKESEFYIAYLSGRHFHEDTFCHFWVSKLVTQTVEWIPVCRIFRYSLQSDYQEARTIGNHLRHWLRQHVLKIWVNNSVSTHWGNF